MTGDRREESVSVSLKELMKLEDERVDREKKLREAHAVAVQRAREEETKRQRDEEARLATARAAEEEAKRKQLADEEAQREAVARAAVEQTRLSVEAKARAEEAERERRHEIELARLKNEAAKGPGIGVVMGSALVGVAVAAAAALALHFAAFKPSSDASLAKLEERVIAAEKRANDATLDAERERTRALKAEADLGVAQRSLDDLKNAAAKPPATPKTGAAFPRGGVAPPPPVTKGPFSGECASGDDHDPLCGRILRK